MGQDRIHARVCKIPNLQCSPEALTIHISLPRDTDAPSLAPPALSAFLFLFPSEKPVIDPSFSSGHPSMRRKKIDHICPSRLTVISPWRACASPQSWARPIPSRDPILPERKSQNTSVWNGLASRNVALAVRTRTRGRINQEIYKTGTSNGLQTGTKNGSHKPKPPMG